MEAADPRTGMPRAAAGGPATDGRAGDARLGEILVVDDEAELRELLVEQLRALGYTDVSTAASAEEALERVGRRTPDLILTDINMPGMNGIELCARLKTDVTLALTPVILLTAVSDREARVAGVAAGADDFFAKPFDLVELGTRVGVLLRVKALVDQLERAESVITTLGLTIEARDPYTGGHCERLARYAVELGRALHVDEPSLRALRLGGYLHDLGEIAVADGILLKPGPLDPLERAAMQRHPLAGEGLIQGLRTLDAVRPIVRHHHERWNGSGYPDGLTGAAIPLGARIMAVVDVYDALRTRRSYKAPMPHRDAVAILLKEAGAGFWDQRIVTAFVSVCESLEATET